MRNQDTLDTIVRYLEGNCGDLLDAARQSGVSLAFLNQWRRDDPETDRIIKEAQLNGVQGLVTEATRRAVHGVPKNVYYRGHHVATDIEYSDTLLTSLLKARVPEFAQPTSAPSVVVNVANLMPRASNYEEWLAMKVSTVSRNDAPPIPLITDAEYTPITSNDPFKASEPSSSAWKGIDL